MSNNLMMTGFIKSDEAYKQPECQWYGTRQSYLEVIVNELN